MRFIEKFENRGGLKNTIKTQILFCKHMPILDSFELCEQYVPGHSHKYIKQKFTEDPFNWSIRYDTIFLPWLYSAAKPTWLKNCLYIF